MNSLTQERLRELLDYDPETGLFTWLTRLSGCIHIGDIAGTECSDGYIAIRISGKAYKAHRLAWLYFYGHFPNYEIDHISGNRADNRITNLRDVSHSVNQQNMKNAPANSKTGLRGVSPYFGKYRAAIRIFGKVKHLGLFNTPEEAHMCYMASKAVNHSGYIQ